MRNLSVKNSNLSEKAVVICFFTLFSVIALISVYPLFWSFNNSLKTGTEYVSENSMKMTESWRFVNYFKVFTEFKYKDFTYLDMLFNSLWMLVVRVVVNVGASTLLAYPIARFRFPGKEFLYGVVIFANTIPIIGSGPAAYKLLSQLNMVNNPTTIWLSWASGFDFAFIVLYGYFKSISPSYSESAYIDGASELKVLGSIMIPQVMPCICAIAITQAISIWNDYSTVMIYLREYPNLAYGIYLFESFKHTIEDSMPIYFAATIISSIPIIILYSCTQNLILTNMATGGLKG